MTKRIVAAFLWFYAGWYAGALIAEFVGVSALLGPIIGAAAAGTDRRRPAPDDLDRPMVTKATGDLPRTRLTPSRASRRR